MASFRALARTTYLGRLLLIPWRMRNAVNVTLPPVGKAVRWAFASREHYNFTYDLDPLNRAYLVSFVSVVSGQSCERIENYIREIENDRLLKEHVARQNRESEERFVADPVARFGRRIGWYALVRAARPKLVVETGVDKGMGTCVLAAALLRNREEGHGGRLVGIDLNPKAGYLVKPPYTEVTRLIFEDSLKALAALQGPVDFFLHDSDHSAEHETKEFQAVQPKLSPNALVLSDNADQTDRLLRFAKETGREFLYFADKPLNHWWPGDGIGVAFRRP
jgi:predicted O-methyltransferase YrrM